MDVLVGDVARVVAGPRDLEPGAEPDPVYALMARRSTDIPKWRAPRLTALGSPPMTPGEDCLVTEGPNGIPERQEQQPRTCLQARILRGI